MAGSGKEAAIDTSRTIEIEASPAKMAFLVVLGIGMTGLFLAMALGLIGAMAVGFMLFLAWFGTAFFGLALFSAVRSMMTVRGVVLTLTPEGIRDRRILKAPIPWAAIRDISTWTYRGQRLMVLKVDPQSEKRLGFNATARWAHRINRLFGADGLCITSQGLKIDYGTMRDTSLAYWHRYGGEAKV